MTCIPLGKHGFLCVGDNDYLISASDKVWRFEWHRYMGPCALHKQTGDPVNMPPENSPFWTAVMKWDKQGRKVVKGIGGMWAVYEAR